MAIFRYPGGKSKLLEPITKALYPVIQETGAFAEPFVGGGSVLVQVAKDFPNIKLYANDKDPYMYAFWSMLADDEDKEIGLFYLHLRQKPTIKLFKQMREDPPLLNRADRAYYAVFFNRTTFSGIQTSGPIGGYEQKGKYKVDCRYNAARIIKEFEALRHLVRGRLTVSNLDCVDFLAKTPEVATYLDPPYFVKGKDLYPVHMKVEEHGALADMLMERRKWVLSYDICPEIDKLYNWARLTPLDARYSITDRKKSWVDKKEYIITPRIK
jgi:DNA adenine methylase